MPCSALPNSAVILRCFFLRYLLTPELSQGARRRAGSTTGEICLNALLSKHVQNGTTFVSRGGTDADAMVAASSDKPLATRQGAFSLTNPSNARTTNADSSDATESTNLRTADWMASVTRHCSSIYRYLCARRNSYHSDYESVTYIPSCRDGPT